MVLIAGQESAKGQRTTDIVNPIGILGVGAALPETVLTNTDLEGIVETTDEWIQSRTGIKERRIAEDGVMTSDLGAEAGAAALSDAGLRAEDLDLILVATSSPDMFFPSTASLVQQKLGGGTCPAFDILAACTGFCYAIDIAASFLRCGGGRKALIIGAEIMSRLVDWNDRRTCVLFGDGAGAAVLGEVDVGYGILASYLASDGSGAELLRVPVLPEHPGFAAEEAAQGTHENSAGGERREEGPQTSHARAVKQVASPLGQGGDTGVPRTSSPLKPLVLMNGQEVYKFAVKVLPQAARKVLEKAGLDIEAVDYFIPHQANKRIIDTATESLGIAADRVVSNIARYGNTSAASIPIAVSDLWHSGRLKRQDLLLLAGFGGGLTWGANLVRWSKNYEG